MGRSTWGDDFSKIEQMIFNKYSGYKSGGTKAKRGNNSNPSGSNSNITTTGNYGYNSSGSSGGNKSSSSSNERTYFCRDFNKNKCKFDDAHNTKFRGQNYWVQHICAECWLNEGKKSHHMECGNECPKHPDGPKTKPE